MNSMTIRKAPALSEGKQTATARTLAEDGIKRLIGIFAEKDENGCIFWHGEFDKDQRPIILERNKKVNVRSRIFRLRNPGQEGKKIFNTCGNKKCIAPEHASVNRRARACDEKLGQYIVTDTGCYVFPHKIALNTQPKVRVKGNVISASRAAYIQANGEIPVGWHIKHTCGTPACINPRHLRAEAPRTERLFREPRNLSAKRETAA
ncbi:HNH endonuclease [Turneriella parva]|uniref:HNH nuclease domain-containing protein n=1 Tax=Turneriella parva (strain ATCC BAA-1111 / DSM 21527 / NCTC 11395 / H) TaxID=869212 RepID=I4B1R6_TURPD|nr:HNH endonuclease [Turneriella parva]AFM11223.1 hypothetical protein Turpa_0571 [Turneriella parva DSM 21527]